MSKKLKSAFELAMERLEKNDRDQGVKTAGRIAIRKGTVRVLVGRPFHANVGQSAQRHQFVD